MKPLLSLALLAFFMAAGAAFADTVRVKPVHLPPGKTVTTLSDRIVGRDSISYTVGAEAGQTMTVSLRSDNAATYFNVYEPGRGPGDQALAVGGMTGPMMPAINRFRATLPTSGTYTVSVYLYRNAARRNERSHFTLDISVSALSRSDLGKPLEADYADGLQGGPDFWEVTMADPAGRASIREKPSAGGASLADVDDGAVLRNLGCRMNEGRRWCRVAALDAPAVEGWASGDVLRESSYQPGQ